jgi:hypothetical protein
MARSKRKTKTTASRGRPRPEESEAKKKTKTKPKAKAKPRKPAKSAPRRRKPSLPRARPLSKHPEAIRSRQRRQAQKPKPRKRARETRAQLERRAIREAEAAERAGLAGRPKIAPERKGRPRKRKGRKAPKPAPPTRAELLELAIGWLEALRDLAATVVETSLDVTDTERDLVARERGRGRAPWLAVGRFEFLDEGMSYERLGEVLEAWSSDLVLEAAIHPDRMSQIRIIYEDPNERRGDGDDFISQIGAWPFVLSDILREVVGTGGISEDADVDALANRYANSIIPRCYVYFSSELVHHKSFTVEDLARRFTT